MRKIAELEGDDFFDAIYALSPILPMICNMEVVQAHLFQNYNETISKARSVVAANTALLKSANAAKKNEYKNKITEANRIIQSEISGIFARDIAKIIPALASKENRNCIFEVLRILDNVPMEEIKKYHPPKLIAKIRNIIKDTDFKSFLSYAEQSE